MPTHCSSCLAGHDTLHRSTEGFVDGHDGKPQAFHHLDTPPELEAAYRDMLATIKPTRTPRLLCRDVVGGAAGRWFSCGVIVLGLNEIDALAEKLWWKLVTEQNQNGLLPDRSRLRFLARAWILAHELGHELSAENRASPHDEHKEAAADYWAGRITGELWGSERAFGEAFFALIGCNEKFCTHPSSGDRARAFRDGFAAGVNVRNPEGTRRTERVASPSAARRESGFEDVVAGVAGVLGFAALAVGVVKLVGALTDGASYDPTADRYRNRKGLFTKG